MIGTGLFADVFGMVPAGDDRIEHVVKAALRSGFAVVLDAPGGKAPLCTLTARAAKAADTAARDAALARGVERVDRIRHACGIAHALQPTQDVKELAAAVRAVRRLTATSGRLNIGIEPRASRLVVVDVDTPAQVDAFVTWWAGVDPGASTGLTVASPGTRAVDGTPVHHGGGHVWFAVPEGVELPTTSGSWSHPDGWAVVWGEHQVLVPPSVRPEGPYRLVGTVGEVPAALVDLIVDRAAPARSAGPAWVVDHDDPVEAYQASTPWATLLDPDGWTLTGTPDGCGCPVWTAPGGHASPKSATAHESGCARYDTSSGWGPLHVWTYNPPAFLAGRGNTFTLVQYVAHRDHDGDMRAAMRATDSLRPPAGELFDPSEDPFDVASGPTETPVTEPDRVEPAVEEPAESAVSQNAPEQGPPTSGLPVLPAEFWEARPALKHIKTAALAEMCSPDAALAVVLTRLAASVDHHVRVDVGLRPASLNLITCPTGPSSAGKGIAVDAGRDLLPPPGGARWPDGLGLGSGEGIAESFMGRVEVETGDVYRSGDRKGLPKVKEVRQQVHHNLLLALDEGQTLARMAERSGATVIQALRSLWSGATLGQANAREESTRHVPAGSYAAGVILSFQPDTASAVLVDTDGLAQRALWISAVHPDISADVVEHPGPLPVTIPRPDPMDPDTPAVLVYPAGVRAAYRAHRAAVARGEVTEGPVDGHLPLLRAKVGALLALLDERQACTDEDWELAGVVVGTSVRVRDALMARQEAVRVEAATAARQAAAAPRVLAELRLDELREQRENKRIERMARTLARKVAEADGPVVHSVARHGLASQYRPMYEVIRDRAEEHGWIVVSGDSSLSVGAVTVG